jgi:hypothetical protein
MATFAGLLQAVEISAVEVVLVEDLFADIIVECVSKGGCQGEMEVVEAFYVFGSKVSLSEIQYQLGSIGCSASVLRKTAMEHSRNFLGISVPPLFFPVCRKTDN